MLLVGDMPSSDPVWGALPEMGFDIVHAPDERTLAAALAEMSFGLALLGLGDEEKTLAACRTIRAHPGHGGIYILILLYDELRDQIGRAFRAGANDVVVGHPLRMLELEARLAAGVRNAHLLQSESRLRTLIANVPGAIYRCANDRNWTMNLISDDIQRISGYPSSDFIDSAVRTFSSVIHPDDRGQVEHDVEAATSEGRPFALEYRIVRRDGTIAWVLERGRQVRDGTGRIWLDGVIFDVSDRKQAEQRLHESERRLAVARDRERIARALHDGVIQVLFGVGTMLRNAQGTAHQADRVRRCLATGIDRIDSVINDLRGYVLELRPGLLADRQLHDAIALMAAEFEDESGIVTAIDVAATVAAGLTGHAEDVLLIICEALSNVRRHAEAATCRVTLKRIDGTATLEIDDDGRGFDPAQVSRRGQGLRNLAERVDQIGGRLDIHSGPAGTTVRVRLEPAG
ncbi:PAS domain-containing protein [Actinomadura graeca]|uniref:PAS domain-containing protein n=1 Tax=Actinomadura graeca TaxID=2750812 RepID=A0ABX8QQI6_9ACTN|nr:PAS domain-containing protein [Actinomadura graeca]QXJ20898.1 PAS domain-containing protein [Actinomadura graeca]